MNFCQLPLLPPFPRATGEPPELPGLGAVPQFELPRASGRDGGLFPDPPECDPATVFCPDWPKRWSPLFELPLELLFPGRGTSRLFPAELPTCRLLFAICDCPRPAERVVTALLPRAEKKC